MKPSSLRLLCVLATLLFIDTFAWGDDDASRTLRFNQDVLPILAENCFACHGFDEAAREADLRLDTQLGAESILTAGDPSASELIHRIESSDLDTVMPPPDSGKRLTESQRKILRLWVQQGAAYEGHWSFEKPIRPIPPTVVDTNHPIDRFVRSRLAAKGLTPSPAANQATLIRRVSLDLTGLPPTPDELDRFLAAAAINPDAAWQDLVDRLLSSPHYGQRWGRWWLDQARYADSNGYSIDGPRSIWKFRDWVIDALNADMPFDQFTIEQLAGDLLPDATVNQQVATGFHRNTQINQEGGIDREQFRIDSVFDRVATTGTVWLGLTIGCAQCHDHKFDPIAQKEFYRLFAFLNNQDEPTIKVYDPGVDVEALQNQRKETQRQLEARIEKHDQEMDAWEAGLTDDQRKKLSSTVRKALDVAKEKRSFAHRLAIFAAGPHCGEENFARLQTIYQSCDAAINDAPTTMVMRERAIPRETSVFIKGDFTRPAEQVNPGTPSVLHPMNPTHEPANRLDLARWIASHKNPLTARVIVNRVWQQYFGVGLVATENDFGLLGSRPSHPKLLDWLAVELVDRDWSLKAIHRLIVNSETYRQSSHVREDLNRMDADNIYLGRQVRLRLDAEVIRDVALSASGMMSHKLGGAPVFPPIPEGVMGQGQVKRTWKANSGEDRYRRGLYTFVYRATPPPSLAVFDAPDGFSTCTRRNRSNTPLQSLTLMNDSAFFELARALSKIVDQEGIEVAFRRCTGRRPDQQEFEILSQLDSLTAARALISLDETITRE